MKKPRAARELGSKKRASPGSKRWHLFLVAALLYFLFLAALISFLFPPTIDLHLGSIAQEDVVAPRNAIFIDHKKTSQLQDLAEQSVMPVYSKDYTTPRQNMVRSQINTVFNTIGQIAANTTLSMEERAARLQEALPATFTPSVIQGALQLEPRLLSTMLSYSLDIAMQFLASGVKEEDMSQLPLRIQEKLTPLNMPVDAKLVIEAACQSAITPNLTLDLEETQRRQQLARNSVDPVQRQVSKGEIVVKQGDTVTQDQMPLLEALGLVRPAFPWEKLIGTVLISLVLFAAWTLITIYFGAEFLTVRRMFFVGLLLVLVVLAARFLPSRFILLVPLPLAGIVLAALFRLPFALVFSIFCALGVGLIQGNDFLLSFALLLGGAAGAYGARRVTKAGDFLAAGLIAGLVLAFTVGAAGLTLGTGVLVLEEMGLALANGLVSGLLAIFILLTPITESLFDLTSPLHLIELANPNHPLLRRLFLEIPGTYLHSVMVASLAEHAATAIGADALLCRVAAYYHDVGKIARPQYFAENQGETNVHDGMTPQLSSRVVIAHAKDGAEMARAAGVPEPVVRIIQSHHGTSLATYFYRQAQRSNETQTPEDSFRYEGPKPSSKEASILMLADGVEAAVRSLKEKSPERIAKMVGHVIGDRVQDGQLECSQLSFQELNRIEEVFTRVLISAYHLRPEYPEAPQGVKQDAGLPAQPSP